MPCVVVLEVDNDSAPPTLSVGDTHHAGSRTPELATRTVPPRFEPLSITTFEHTTAADGGLGANLQRTELSAIGKLHLYRQSTEADEMFSTGAMAVASSSSPVLVFLGVPIELGADRFYGMLEPMHININSVTVITEHDWNTVLVHCATPALAETVQQMYTYTVGPDGVENTFIIGNVGSVQSLCSWQLEGFLDTMNVGLELPTCPACLSSLDESVQDVVEVQAEDPTRPREPLRSPHCDVCALRQDSPVACFQCDTTDRGIWTCLVCGFVGCGRKQFGEKLPLNAAHAILHFHETKERHAMVLSASGEIWNYSTDQYVHRVDQFASFSEDEKGIMMSSPDKVDPTKQDAIAMEYSSLLSDQLESQRRYFTERMSRIEHECTEKLRALEREEVQIGGLIKASALELNRANTELAGVQEQNSLAHKEFKAQLAAMRSVKGETKALLAARAQWEAKIQACKDDSATACQVKEQEIVEIRQGLEDLRLHMQRQREIAKAPEQQRKAIQEGKLVLSPGSESGTKKKRNPKKR